MAIVIEEGKKKINWFAWFVVVVLVGIVGASIYYFFFSPVPLVEKVIPGQLQSIQSISSNGFRPDSIVNDPTYQILKVYVNPIELPPSIAPRANPFVPFR